MTAPSTPASGPLAPAGYCAACGTALAAGARFCHRCGTPFGQGAPVAGPAAAGTSSTSSAAQGGGLAAIMPWGVAFVAILALVAMLAGQRFGAAGGSTLTGSANSLPTQALDGRAAAQAGGAPFAGGAAGGPAPDITNMSPAERAERLFERVMVYYERGAMDSVTFFAPMALASHEMLDSMSLDERYHYGRIAIASALPELAQAQADTILQRDGGHLLGLLLAGDVARQRGDSILARTFDAQFLERLDGELARQLPEYGMHRNEIDLAAANARAGSR